jgi:hypothetical protein
MANPAINIALIAAAQQQAQTGKALTDQLKTAGATHVRAARPLDLSVKGSDAMLAYLVKRGHIREAGGGTYWLDEDAIARSTATGTRVALVLLAFLLSAGASLLALTAF